MASQIFNFPGFFDREIDLSAREESPTGTPAGVIGGSERGPAFVPYTVGSFADYRTIFGDLNTRYAAPYAADKFLANRSALTFIRILNAGANETSTDIDTTRTQGTVKNAGFIISGAAEVPGNEAVAQGVVQFIVANHYVSGNEAYGLPMFTDNDSFATGSDGAWNGYANLVRGVIFCASGTRMQILSHDQYYSETSDDAATPSDTTRYFKIAISSSLGTSFGNDEGFDGVRIFTASLNPTEDNYFAKLLNTDPERFADERHLVYADYAVDAEIATLESGIDSVAIASGSASTSSTSGDSSLPFLNAFGRFDTRYTAPKSPWFISQPYGETEHDLFYIEAIDDGAYANSRIKVSILDIQKSANPKDKYGTFNLVVRDFFDTDVEPRILEQFSNMTLNPDSDNYIGKVIGDKKARFNFDAADVSDRRLLTTGKFANRSRNVRVVISDQVAKKAVPADAVPFGFRGVEVLNTNSALVDTTGSAATDRLHLRSTGTLDTHGRLLGAIVPPIPHRYKVTRGATDTDGSRLAGAPGTTEITDGRYYWGVKFTRNSNALNPNVVELENKLIKSMTKFAGISKLDMLVTGSQKDTFNNNKFTLARVALGNGALADITSSVNKHMKETVYFRNGRPDGFEYKIIDPMTDDSRITFATLYQKGATASDFNKFTNFTKFTTFLYGGFDGTNILDKNAATFNDRSTSAETRTSDGEIGNAAATFTSPGLASNVNGAGISNSTVASYRAASDIVTDAIASNVNIVATPGQRDPLVTDYVSDAVRDFGIAFYVMDIPLYDSDIERIWDDETSKYVDVEQTANSFELRALDNEYAGAYFPDVVIEDIVNRRRVTVPSTVGAIAALGFNDRIAYPWFAPAGFNRASLDFVTKTKVKIKQPERERLFAIHVNPITKFPGTAANVIFAQNTLEQAESALGSINVVRMLNELKRQIIDIGNRTIWEQITPTIYTELEKSFRNVLNTITSRAGIERYDVVVDERNNTNVDRDNNKVNVRIVLVPTRAVEFIAVDFIITRSGVQFAS